jgi:hypothetical protein
MMEEGGSYEFSVNFYLTTRHITENSNLQLCTKFTRPLITP